MSFQRIGIMVDCSRNAVPTVKTMKNFIDIMKDLGYNTLMLYTEDTYEVEGQSYFGYMRGKYSIEEMQEIDNYCYRKNIECIPCIQTLAHLNAFVRWNVDIDCNDILLVGHKNTYKLIEDMFKTISKTFRSKIIHIGMDEAHFLGRGKYLDNNGYIPLSEIIKNHLNKVQEIADKYGYESLIWSDMLFREKNNGLYYTDNKNILSLNANKILSENVYPVYWDYYSTDKKHYDTMIEAHEPLNKSLWFAGGFWKWNGFNPANSFSIDTNIPAVKSCREHNVENIIFTMWGDDGAEASLYSILPSMFYTSQLINGTENELEIKDNFEKYFGINFDDFMEIDLPGFENKNPSNQSKYMLYNDYFCGLFDEITTSKRNDIYKDASKKLYKLSNHEKYGYIFDTLASLCDILALKNDIGIRTRKLYRASNKKELRKIIKDYEIILKKIEIFYEKFKAQWFNENKPYGFEIQDMRIGGIIQRTKSCIDRLDDYCENKINIIDELEEDTLDPGCIENGNKREICATWRDSFANVL